MNNYKKKNDFTWLSKDGKTPLLYKEKLKELALENDFNNEKLYAFYNNPKTKAYFLYKLETSDNWAEKKFYSEMVSRFVLPSFKKHADSGVDKPPIHIVLENRIEPDKIEKVKKDV